LLQKEFPLLKSYPLPSYNIKYSKSGKNLKFKLLLSIPSVIAAVKKEHKLVAKLIKKEAIVGSISDNRFGVYNSNVPSVYITHQLMVLSGKTTGITSKTHQKIIKNFNECWVPDIEKEPNFSGILGHLQTQDFNLKYLGVLSRFKPEKSEITNDLMVLLSGPEPQRTLLEEKLLIELENYQGKVLFVRGTFEKNTVLKVAKNIKIINFLLTNALEEALNRSEIVIARSGYSTIMDLAVLGKKAFFIPTPGQFEQEYLAKTLKEKLIAPFSNQQDFSLEKLNEIVNYTGFKKIVTSINLNHFHLFERK
jgi:predicted glycosyltransferase